MSDPVTGFKRRRPSYLGEALEAIEAVESLPPSDMTGNETNDEILHSLYTRAVAVGEATGRQDQFPALDAAYAARHGRSIEEIEAAGISTDAASMTVLVQSIANGIGNDPRRLPPVACEPGTLWAWTKYFQNVNSVGPPDNENTLSGGAHLVKRQRMGMENTAGSSTTNSHRFDLLSSVASCPDLLFLICANLRPADILVLYRVSRVFKATIDADLASNSARLARLYAPESLAVFPWDLYKVKTSLSGSGDPTSPPTLRYFAMLVSRERKVRDIIACLARAGHRLPRLDTSLTLKKMWLLLDTATTGARETILGQIFTDNDLLIMQMFCVKVVLHLHDPLFSTEGIIAPSLEAGPLAVSNNGRDSTIFAHVLLGQRSGLDPLWQLLRGRGLTTGREAVEVKVRYDYLPPMLPSLATLIASRDPEVNRRAAMSLTLDPEIARILDGISPSDITIPDTVPELGHRDYTKFSHMIAALHAVPLWEMGVGSLEGWGKGMGTLLRPDELLPIEAARRGLDLTSHVPFMAIWGYRDFDTGTNLVPTLEELYMSDEEEADHVKPAAKASTEQPKQPKQLKQTGEEPMLERDALTKLLQEHHRDIDAAQYRLRRLCGNVPCAPGEWQPWQVLKAQWPELPLQQKVDIWWMCQQERLKLQAWMVEGEGDEGLSMDDVQSVSDDDDDDDGGDEMDHDASENEVTMEDVMHDLDELDYLDGYDTDTDSDMFVLDNRPSWDVLNGGGSSSSLAGLATMGNDITYPRLLHHHHRHHRRHRNANLDSPSRVYPPSGPQGPATASDTTFGTTFGTTLGAIPVAAPAPSPGLLMPGHDDRAPLRVSSQGTIISSSRSFSLRHRRLMAACVQSALQDQAVADAELVAQADDSYEDEELEWWEQQMEGTDGGGPATTAGHAGAHTGMNSGAASPAPSSTGATSSTDSNQGIVDDGDTAIRPERVQIRHFGGEEDVVELLDLLVNAEAAAAAAAVGSIATADGGDELAARVEFLQELLEHRLKAEVFAVDISEM